MIDFSIGAPRFPRALSLLCLAAASTLSARGQVADQAFEGAAFSASPAEVLAAAAKVAPEKYAPVTVLYEEDKNSLDAEGRVTNVHRLVYRIETQAGVEGWSESSVEWEAFYQKEPTLRARVIRPDGGAVELDQKTITDVPARNEEDGTYSDERIHKAPLPALGVGAIVESETTRVDKEPYFSGGGVYRFYLQRGVPIARTRIIVEAPATLPIQYKVGFLPDLAVKDETSGGVRRLVFEQGHLDPLVNSDIGLATSLPRVPSVEVATGTSWASVAASYRALAEPRIQPDQVREFVRGVGGAQAPSSADDAARLAFIQALVSKLHKEVRYTGIEFGQSKLQPETPAEVLKRHYGDCKDKAALLVAMLRASGIPANLALLNAGPGRDVTPELAGMNQFDHAIAYVPPAAPGGKPIWIDATAEFTRVGDLPYGDQGRLALIIAEGSKDLTPTPEARPEDSVLVETRDFTLADYGPARAVESSQTTGYVDSAYRAEYGDPANKELRATMENYVRNAYAAKSLAKIESGDPKDFNKPFSLRLQIEKTKRGNTGISDAAIAMYPTAAFSELPRWFFVDPDGDNHELTAEEQADRRKAEAQRSSEYEVQPFVSERRYRVTPPPGFLPRALPADKTTPMGPASLTQTYSADAAGVVTAVFRFTTGKARYTAEEALALRKAVIAADKEDNVTVVFDQSGAKQIAAGKVREGLEIDRGLVAARPSDPLPHIQLAYALLTAGVGEAARAEALKATELAPKSALAFSALGWVSQFNAIGVQFGKGFELAGGIAAYKKAKALGEAGDGADLETRANLAILYEYNADGVRYAPDAALDSAILEFRELAKLDKPTGERYEDNILFDLLYSHRYKELLSEIDPLPSSPARNSLAIAATTATDGLDAGLKRADRVSGDAAQRSAALQGAGQQLIALRLYPEAAGVLSASIQGQENAAAIARQIEVIRNLRPYSPSAAANTGPTGPIERMIAAGLTNRLDEATFAKLLSRHSFANEAEWASNLKKSEQAGGAFGPAAQHTASLADIIMGTMKLSAKGDDATGYRVTWQAMGAAAHQFFVAKEEDGYKIVASQGDFAEVGNAALYFLHHGNEPAARALLDWKRDTLHKGGGDDPLEGPFLPRFWTSGESKGADAIELASAALLVSKPNVAELLPAVVARRDRWTSAQGKPDTTDLNLLLAAAYITLGDGLHAKLASEALLKDWPDSNTAIRLAGEGYGLNHDWTAWNALVDSRLDQHPGDRNLLIEKGWAQQAQGDFAGARKTLRAVLDGAEANSNDYNNYSWNALFEKKVDEDAIQAAQQANMLSKNTSFADLHTLACLYAAQGKTTEAKQVLLQAMAAGNLTQPNSATWYGFGAIYQQYGVTDAAIAAFKKVEKPERTVSPTDTYVLAQAHLKELGVVP
jgi:transglutaminase-like putative cysteine protease/tetratricopeptide (TPR) repeat protein